MPADSTFSGPMTSIFHVSPVQYRKQKGGEVWNFALLLVVFKWRHGSEGVQNEMGGKFVKLAMNTGEYKYW